ncbi:hypothetical protein [Campylobacter fetus]|uniref:Uncharacterized protein n=2 Tax=Campylobacter fetus TaxID=196 RepID=A0RQG1_CAMFF|nr:hypothetical protein [Campylobacter fetus]ABK83140.1 hypothetical protein CFF8240_1288 [Campylobacter fetus subsp. fetus 82-40]CDF65348.1 hypothetical protein CSG_14370 [Campylobacter fetus subsp. venerealis str. 84-112]
MFLPSNSPNIAPSILMENTGFTLFTSKLLVRLYQERRVCRLI